MLEYGLDQLYFSTKELSRHPKIKTVLSEDEQISIVGLLIELEHYESLGHVLSMTKCNISDLLTNMMTDQGKSES